MEEGSLACTWVYMYTYNGGLELKGTEEGEEVEPTSLALQHDIRICKRRLSSTDSFFTIQHDSRRAPPRHEGAIIAIPVTMDAILVPRDVVLDDIERFLARNGEILVATATVLVHKGEDTLLYVLRI